MFIQESEFKFSIWFQAIGLWLLEVYKSTNPESFTTPLIQHTQSCNITRKKPRFLGDATEAANMQIFHRILGRLQSRQRG